MILLLAVVHKLLEKVLKSLAVDDKIIKWIVLGVDQRSIQLTGVIVVLLIDGVLIGVQLTVQVIEVPLNDLKQLLLHVLRLQLRDGPPAVEEITAKEEEAPVAVRLLALSERL